MRDSAALAQSEAGVLQTVFAPKLNSSKTFPFDSILFKDVRFDTANIGATNNVDMLRKNNNFVFIKIHDGLAAFLNGRLNSRATAQLDSLSEKLVCYIRKFRVTEVDTTSLTYPRRMRQLQIRSSIDAFYFKEGLLYPAFKSDTSFLQSFPDNRKRYLIIDSLILAFCEKASQINRQAILRRRSFSQSYADSVYRARFNVPILNAQTLMPGVYLSMKEFQNNKPSIQEYEWKPDRAVNILYTKERDGNWVVTRREVFGFCDGRNIWFRIENSFFPGFQEGNTFQVIAPIYLKRKKSYGKNYTYITKKGGYTYGDVITVDEKDRSVYQLDMDTGEFY